MEELVVRFSLVVSRVAVIVGLTPFLGGQQLPRLVRVGIAVSLALVWSGVPIDASTRSIFAEAGKSLGLWSWLIAREVLIGLALALAMRCIVVPARIAGEFIAQEMLLSFAPTTHPGSDTPSTLLGQFLELLALALFFGVDGQHLILAILHLSWAHWPIGQTSIWSTIDWLSGCQLVLESGVRLAFPVVASLFLLGVGLALLARAAPSLNLFSLGFVVRVLGGLLAMYLFWPVILVGLIQAMDIVSHWLTR